MNQCCAAGDFTSALYSQGIFQLCYVLEYNKIFIQELHTGTIHHSDRLNRVNFVNS